MYSALVAQKIIEDSNLYDLTKFSFLDKLQFNSIKVKINRALRKKEYSISIRSIRDNVLKKLREMDYDIVINSFKTGRTEVYNIDIYWDHKWHNNRPLRD